ncbi:hypothetical protein [Deinococcus multiflagellatus]|uniref:Uncharacterized protein n=1 Tax=Deinococcus multiflagellatus TaxID=1656887 RepID=A0ABW1ZH38_9DEIO
MASARAALARAERDYQLAVARGRPEALKTATEGLTAAIKGQREALTGLAEEYRKQIAGMEGVQAAAGRLDKVAYGDAGRTYDFNRENERLQAIQARRDAAQVALATALQTGQKDQIAEAADELAKQEERYKKQADLMEKNGSQINRTGEKTTQKLADQVDQLGIQYDREILNLQERARVVDREAEAVMSFGVFVRDFAGSVQALRAPAATAPVATPSSTTVTLDQVSLDALRRVRPDPVSVLSDQLQFARWLRQHQGATTMAAPTYITNVEVGEIIVKPPPGSDIKRVARAVKAELFDEARKSGKGTCWP